MLRQEAAKTLLKAAQDGSLEAALKKGGEQERRAAWVAQSGLTQASHSQPTSECLHQQ